MGKRLGAPYRIYARGQTLWAYFATYSQDGKKIQFRCSCGTNVLKEAEQFCNKKLAELQDEAKRKASGELPSLTVDEAFGRYFAEKGQYLTLPKQRYSRLQKLKEDLNVEYLDEITEVHISNFITKNRQTLKNATINRYLFLLSAVLKTASEEWLIKTPRLKVSKFKLKEPAENIKYFKDFDYVQRIIDKADDHLKPIIYVGIYTGLRVGNILELKWDEIDFSAKKITLLAKDSTKENGKIHTIPIIDKLIPILQAQPKINEYVFNYKGKPIKRIDRSWHSIFFKFERVDKIEAGDVYETRKIRNKKTGKMEDVLYKRFLIDETLPYTNFHTLRHTAATWVLRKTNNLRITKDVLGHSNINTTLKYAHVLDNEKREALDSVFE